MRANAKVVVAAVLGVIIIVGGMVVLLWWMVSNALGQFTGEGDPDLEPLLVSQPSELPAHMAPPSVTQGYDVSYPQCGEVLPEPDGGFAVIGVHGGRPFTANDCFAEQLEWAQQFDAYAVYINTEDRNQGDASGYGKSIAVDALERMEEAGVPEGVPVWLDVETNNYWEGDRARHRELLQATAQEVADAGHPVGVYSAPRLWAEITGDVDPGMPVWFAVGSRGEFAAADACSTGELGGRAPAMTQWIETESGGREQDRNLLCEPAGADTNIAGLLAPSR